MLPPGMLLEPNLWVDFCHISAKNFRLIVYLRPRFVDGPCSFIRCRLISLNLICGTFSLTRRFKWARPINLINRTCKRSLVIYFGFSFWSRLWISRGTARGMTSWWTKKVEIESNWWNGTVQISHPAPVSLYNKYILQIQIHKLIIFAIVYVNFVIPYWLIARELIGMQANWL